MRILTYLTSGTLVVLLIFVYLAPAEIVSKIIKYYTNGKLLIINPSGTIWDGSGYLGYVEKEKKKYYLDRRIFWKTSIDYIKKEINYEFRGPYLKENLSVTVGYRTVKVFKNVVELDADILKSLGQPFNTLDLTGYIYLNFSDINISIDNQKVSTLGKVSVELRQFGSVISPINPIGDYDIVFIFKDKTGTVSVSTLKGLVTISGKGKIYGNQISFEGTASTQTLKMKNFINLMGQWNNSREKDYVKFKF